MFSEIEAALEWHFDDDEEGEEDVQLATLPPDDTRSADVLAQALQDFGTLANAHAEDLAGLGGV